MSVFIYNKELKKTNEDNENIEPRINYNKNNDSNMLMNQDNVSDKNLDNKNNKEEIKTTKIVVSSNNENKLTKKASIDNIIPITSKLVDKNNPISSNLKFDVKYQLENKDRIGYEKDETMIPYKIDNCIMNQTNSNLDVNKNIQNEINIKDNLKVSNKSSKENRRARAYTEDSLSCENIEVNYANNLSNLHIDKNKSTNSVYCIDNIDFNRNSDEILEVDENLESNPTNNRASNVYLEERNENNINSKIQKSLFNNNNAIKISKTTVKPTEYEIKGKEIKSSKNNFVNENSNNIINKDKTNNDNKEDNDYHSNAVLANFNDNKINQLESELNNRISQLNKKDFNDDKIDENEINNNKNIELNDSKNKHYDMSKSNRPIVIFSSSTVNSCRICLENEEESNEKLISPCKCTGSVKYVHGGCLIKSVESLTKMNCEICQETYYFKVNFKRVYTNQRICRTIEIAAFSSVVWAVIIFLVALLIYFVAVNVADVSENGKHIALIAICSVAGACIIGSTMYNFIIRKYYILTMKDWEIVEKDLFIENKTMKNNLVNMLNRRNTNPNPNNVEQSTGGNNRGENLDFSIDAQWKTVMDDFPENVQLMLL